MTTSVWIINSISAHRSWSTLRWHTWLKTVCEANSLQLLHHRSYRGVSDLPQHGGTGMLGNAFQLPASCWMNAEGSILLQDMTCAEGNEGKLQLKVLRQRVCGVWDIYLRGKTVLVLLRHLNYTDCWLLCSHLTTSQTHGLQKQHLFSWILKLLHIWGAWSLQFHPNVLAGWNKHQILHTWVIRSLLMQNASLVALPFISRCQIWCEYLSLIVFDIVKSTS